MGAISLAADGAPFEESVQRALAILYEPTNFYELNVIATDTAPDAERVFGHADISGSFGRGEQWIGGLVL